MKGFFYKDSVLKVISFIVAILIWSYIIIVIDPSVDITIRDIPIRYSNRAYLKEQGLSLVNDNKATVELKVRGSRKKIANIDNKNVYATVDLSGVSKKGTFSLPISISIPYEYNEIVSKNPYNIEVVIDKTVKEERDIKLIETGSTANGYIAGKAALSTQKVTLEGAESVLKSISGVAAVLDYDDRSAAISDVSELYFIGEDNKRIAKDSSIYSMVEMSESSVEINCDVFRLKTVPVKVEYDDSSQVSDFKVSVQPSNVTIYAENEVLDATNEILTKAISFAELSENGTVSAELVFPEGVKARDVIKEVTIKAETK